MRNTPHNLKKGGKNKKVLRQSSYPHYLTNKPILQNLGDDLQHAMLKYQ